MRKTYCFSTATIITGMHLNVTFTRTLRVLLLYTNAIRNQWWHAKYNEIKYVPLTLSCLADISCSDIEGYIEIFNIYFKWHRILRFYRCTLLSVQRIVLPNCGANGSAKGLIVGYKSTQVAKTTKVAEFYQLLTAFRAWMICLLTDLLLSNLWNQSYYLSM